MNIVRTLHMPPTFLIYSPFCHSTSIASSAWVTCLSIVSLPKDSAAAF